MENLISSLNNALEIAELRRQLQHVTGDFHNVSIERFVNRKSSLIQSWAQEHGITFFSCNAGTDTSVVYKTNAFGILEPHEADAEVMAEQLLFNDIAHLLDKERVIIYLPNYHYATPANKKVFDRLMNTHCLKDPQTGNDVLWESLLFIVMDNEVLG